MLRSDPAPLPPAPVLAAVATFLLLLIYPYRPPSYRLELLVTRYRAASFIASIQKIGRCSSQRLPLRTAILPQNVELLGQPMRGHEGRRQER